MEEKKIYHEIPGGRNKFHSAIFTTYSFNFHHFEYQTLKTLKQKWVINVGLLVDSQKLDEVLGFSSGGLKQLTKSYSINGVHSKGAFHPKINFLIGEGHLLMVLGSGNLTPGGQGKNHETFSALYANSKDEKLVPLLNEAYNYIKQISKEVNGFSRNRILNTIPSNCSLLNNHVLEKHTFYKADSDLQIALLYNDESSIYSQISSLVPTKEIKRIRVLSPYFDNNGQLIENFLIDFPKADIEIYLSDEYSLPPVEFKENGRVKFYDWKDTKRAKKGLSNSEKYNRKLHSKLFQFDTDTQSFFTLGSANATIAAFGSNNSRGINEEFNLLYKSKPRDFFKEMGVSGKKRIELIHLKRDEISFDSSPETLTKNKRAINITSCDLENHTLKITLKILSKTENCSIFICNDIGESQLKENIKLEPNIRIELSEELLSRGIAFVQIESKDGKLISNKQVINFTKYLFETDPSKENRTIRAFRHAIEIGKANEFELLELLNKIHFNNGEQHVNEKNSTGTILNVKEINSTITYAEAIEASKNKKHEHSLISNHSTIQFWQTLNSLFSKRYESAQNTLIDEEEEANAETSNARNIEIEEREQNHLIKDQKALNKVFDQTYSLKQNYIKAVKSSSIDKSLKINEIVFCQYLLVGHVITNIHLFKQYDLPKDEKGKYQPYTPEQWNKHLKGKYSDLITEVINVFAKFCLTHEVVKIDDNSRQNQFNDYVQSTMAYTVLFHYLMNGNKDTNERVEVDDLACLTIFHNLGYPEEESIENLIVLAKSNTEELYDITNVKRVFERLIKIKEKIKDKDGYFFHKNLGVCHIKEQNSSRVVFKSIFDMNYNKIMKMKEFRKL